MTKQRAIIIGAGYGGIALANLLGKAGYRVDVYEKNDTIGGRISAFKQDGFTFDIGPSWYLMPEVFEQYYSLFGLSATERLEPIPFSPAYKVFFENGEPVVVHGDVKKDKELFESIEPGSGSVLEQYVATSEELYDVSVSKMLYSNFTRPSSLINTSTLGKAPRLLGKVFQSLDAYVSKNVRDQRLKQLLEYHSVFLGSSPFEAPAIYSLMSHLDFNTGVYYPKHGMLSLPKDLADIGASLDIHYHVSSPVRSIVTEHGIATGVTLADDSIETADIIVSNADLHFTETTLLNETDRTYPTRYWSKRQAGPGGLLISLGIKGQLPALQHHSLFFTDKWEENFRAIYTDKTVPEHASFYVCNPNKTDQSLAPAGHENLFILVPLPSGVSLSPTETDALTNTIIASLAHHIDESELPSRIVSKLVFGPDDIAKRYNAWEYNAFGGESHILKQSILFRTRNKSKKLKNLYYVGAGTAPGIGLPMCLISAELTYKRIMGITHNRPLEAVEIKEVRA